MTAQERDAADGTLRAYERGAHEYSARTPLRRSPLVDELVDLVPAGSTVLELGSGPGRDARALEQAGLTVHRTDGASSFVEQLRSQGHDAHILDMRADDFGGPYNAIFANAVLLHVPRESMRSVLEVAHAAVRGEGILTATVKEGDGEGWSYDKLADPRFFTYWQKHDIERTVLCAGWAPIRVYESTLARSKERWITVLARRSSA